MSDNLNDRDPLEELAAEFTQRFRHGERPSVDEYAQRHPEMAEDIRELFSMIRTFEQAKHASGSNPVVLTAEPPVPLERLGDFRIIRELGRGGMGIVYEAEQESLGRRVAIKVLPDRHLWSEVRRERFEREARIAGKLHHTNVVPIFGVGEENGYHYFVMQYIRGVGLDAVFSTLSSVATRPGGSDALSLLFRQSGFDFAALAKDLLERRSSDIVSASGHSTSVTEVLGPSRELGGREQTPGWPSHQSAGAASITAPGITTESSSVTDRRYYRRLARLIAQAADALAYAHAQGVLHRDIKPANLLLDADGTLWVADFGLAKGVEHDEITQAGDILGTLRYISPEQYQGRGEARSDIYSLGITLYELVTLRTAFARNNGGTMFLTVLDRPLTPPRQFCPDLPRDLETIILKATAREPSQRYASAADLRDDLRRFVDDRPILARRISSIERFWRWSRRNPALAATSALALALLVTIAGVSSGAYFKVRLANSRTQTALEGQTRQRERAEVTANLAVEAIDTIFDEFAPESPLVSREFNLGDADTTVGSGESGGGEAATESDAAVLTVSVPPVLSEETANLLNHMLDFYRRLARQEGGSLALQFKMAAAQRRVGEIQELLGHYDEAKAAYDDSIRQYEQLRAAAPNDKALVVAVARLHNQSAHVLLLESDIPDAFERLQTARVLLQQHIQVGEDRADLRFELARTCYLMARPLSGNLPGGAEMGPPPEEERGRFRARRDGADRSDRGVSGPRWPASQRGTFGDGRPGLDLRERRGYLDEAIGILIRLTVEAPRVPEYRQLLAQCYREQRPRRPFMSEPAADESLERAIEILEELVAEFPQVPQYRFDLAETYALRDRGPDGRRFLEKAIEEMKRLVQERPGVPSYQFSLANMYMHLARIDGQERDPDAAMAHVQAALAIGTRLTEQFRAVEHYRLAAALYESALAELLQDHSEVAEARRLLESAVGRLESLIDPDEVKPHVRFLASRCYDQLADVCERLGEQSLSRESREKAEALRPDRRRGPPPPDSGLPRGQ